MKRVHRCVELLARAELQISRLLCGRRALDGARDCPRAVLALLLAAAFTPGWAGCQRSTLQPMPITALLAQHTLSTAFNGGLGDLTADGAIAAFTGCDPRRLPPLHKRRDNATYSPTGSPWFAVGCEVFIQPTGGGPSRAITGEGGSSWAPAWSPDGRFLALFSDRDGAPRLWIWERETGRLRRVNPAVVRVDLAFRQPVWTHDGKEILVPLLPVSKPGAHASGTVVSSYVPDYALPPHGSASVRVMYSPPRDTLVPRRSAPAAMPEWEKADIAAMNVRSGVVRRLLRDVSTKDIIASPVVSDVAVMVTKPLQRSNAAGQLADIVLLPLGGGAPRVIARDLLDRGAHSAPMSWSPDGRWIAYVSERWDGKADCYVADLQTDERRLLTGRGGKRFIYSGFGPLWDAESEAVFLPTAHALWRMEVETAIAQRLVGVEDQVVDIVSARHGQEVWSPRRGTLVLLTRDSATKRAALVRVDIAHETATAGDELQASFGAGANHAVGAESAPVALFVREDATHPPDLWVATGAWGSARRLTQLNPSFDRLDLGESRLVHWKRRDGSVAAATILLPAGYVAGQKYPTIVWLYPSSKGSDYVFKFGLWAAPFNMQLLASRGYVVLYPDCDVRFGTPMRDILDEVMPAVDRLAQLGITDTTRLGVMGQSYGGYGVYSLVVQTPRFKAAVLSSGLVDLTALYGVMRDDGVAGGVQHLETGQGHIGAPPWGAPERYIENSPIYFLDKIQTPMLIQAGLEDPNVPAAQADEAFVGLRRLGKEVTLIKYSGEEHVLKSYTNVTDFWERVLAFFSHKLA